MTNKINTTHFIFYYDTEMNEADGNGWCVELSNDSTTYRFMQPDHATEFIQNNAGMLVATQESAVA
jgi:hypothetical protein